MDIFYDTQRFLQTANPFVVDGKSSPFQFGGQTGNSIELGLQMIYPRPHFNTSEPHQEHKKFPYFLKGLKIDLPNQVWSTDITYTAVNGHRAFVIAIEDWFSRKLMAYNVVNTMDAFHCVETLRMAIERFGKPEIIHRAIRGTLPEDISLAKFYKLPDRWEEQLKQLGIAVE